METARSEVPRDGTDPDPAAEGEPRAAESHSFPTPEAGAQLAQATTTGQGTPPPDTEGAAAAGVADDAEGGERSSVLSEFLADGPPQIDEDQATGERRPVQMEREQAGTPPQPADDAPPRETAADAPVPDSGGSSFYDDNVGSLVPALSEMTLPSDLAGDPVLPDSADPLLVGQFDEPVALSSLAGVEPVGSNMDAPTPALEPLPTDPDPETDPLTERRIAAGEDLEGEDTSDGGGGTISGTAGDDSLTGSADGETLDGGPGDDTLMGAGGQDIFGFSVTDGGNDVVTDFETGSGGDIVRLTDVTDADGNGTVELADLDADPGNSVSSPAGSLILGFASGASLTLSGVDGSGIGSFADLATSNVNVDVA